ncbi:MAG: dTDP-4-dehydrorhamnose 3,5-epimerase [Candidatus Cloacimonetes bacterium]|nr:dTDP-4-dehydrorhamnose 3,5-epimerase [Candidatus Cloacimonadota bacterium]
MLITELPLRGARLVRPPTHGDERGSLTEVWNRDKFTALGVSEVFVQDNWTISKRGALRGMHYQIGAAAHAKLIRCARGRIFDVIVDIRRSSPTFGKALGVELGEDPMQMLLVPVGFAHGFLTLSEEAWISYKLTHAYSSEFERGIQALDEHLGLEWPMAVEDCVQSGKDLGLPPLSQQIDLFP